MSDPRQQIWPLFVAESREHLQLAGESLLSLERPVNARAPGAMTLLQRALHSLKGGAGSLGFEHLERLAHTVESALALHPPEPVLAPDLVQRVLEALARLDEMLNHVEAGVGDTPPAELDALIAALGGQPAPRPPPSAGSGDDSLVLELWPVFRADVTEALQQLAEALRRADSRPPPQSLARLTELADIVAHSGATLGLDDLSNEAGALQRALATEAWAADTGAQLRRLIEGLDRRVAELDERVEQVAPRPSAPPPLPSPVPQARGGYFTEARELLTQLEAATAQLLTPDEDVRAAAREELQRLTHRLKGTTTAVMDGELPSLSRELHETARALGAGGVEGAMTSARFAKLVVSFGQTLATAERDAATPALPRPSSPTPVPTARLENDTVIRVGRSAVEALTDVLDRAAMSRARRETQLRALLELRALTQETLLWAERAGSELRLQSVQAPHLTGARERLRTLSRGMKQVSAELWRDLESERIQGAQLNDTLRELRTVPALTLGELLRRTARETAGRVGKTVQFELAGGEVRLDRRIVDAVRDPLLHLLRNAVDHGIEAPQTRLKLGKPADGRITLSVQQHGGRVHFTLEDDGAGVDLDRIRARALSRGLVEPHALGTMSDDDVARLIFLPGFSTAEQLTELSGRGVGLDVVESAAKHLGGAVTLRFEPGRGSTFELSLPRALGAMLVIVAQVGATRLALPTDAVQRLLRLSKETLVMVGARPMARVGEALVPFIPLSRVLTLPGARLPFEGGRPVEALLVSVAGSTVALGVDECLQQQEVVVHPLGKHLRSATHLAGAAQLNDGAVVPVLQPGELLARALASTTSESAAPERPVVLVVDDALSTRTAVRNVLELAGFEVLSASNGEEAWDLLQSHRVALLVTDLQMPRLDGMGLTRRLRADPQLAEVPVVVLTAQDSAEDRALGLEAGADAYLVKREIERGALLEHVRQLLAVDA